MILANKNFIHLRFLNLRSRNLLLHISSWYYPWSALTIKSILRLTGHEK